MCDVGEDERLGLGTGWPAEEVWQNIELPGSVLDVKCMTLQFEGPTHQFCILIAHGFDVAKRLMVRPDRHRCCAEVRRKGLRGYDKGEGLLLDRTVISFGCSKLAAQVAVRMFYIIHNLEQNCTQTSLGSINYYRKGQVIIGWSQYWTGRQT